MFETMKLIWAKFQFDRTHRKMLKLMGETVGEVLAKTKGLRQDREDPVDQVVWAVEFICGLGFAKWQHFEIITRRARAGLEISPSFVHNLPAFMLTDSHPDWQSQYGGGFHPTNSKLPEFHSYQPWRGRLQAVASRRLGAPRNYQRAASLLSNIRSMDDLLAGIPSEVLIPQQARVLMDFVA